MLNTYYRIWVDAITQERSKKGDNGSWKAFTIIPISLLMGVNLLTLIFILRLLTHGSVPIVVPLDIFRYRAVNTFIAGAFTFFIPFLVLNYLLVFYNERYQKLQNLYRSNEGKSYRNYFFISVGVIVVPLLLKIIF